MGQSKGNADGIGVVEIGHNGGQTMGQTPEIRDNCETLVKPSRSGLRGLVLGIDPGTNCGWALLDWDGRRVASGVWDLSPRRHEGGGMRFLRFQKYLEQMTTPEHPIDAIAYEEVRRHRGTSAAHIYGGIVAVLSGMAEQHAIPYKGIAVGTIKKHATGRGNANKDDMIRSARETFGMSSLSSDDEADALFCAKTLIYELGG